MSTLSEQEVKERIAKRVAQELPEGGVVKLGVGIPTLAVDFLPEGKEVFIQTENGMSTLIKLPEAEKIFGKNLAFELNALFCDTSGPNLRNELAHGLLSEEDCKSAHSIYAWWLALRLTIITWWNSMHSQGSSSEPSGNE